MEIFKLFGSIFIDDKSAIDSLNNVDGKAEKTGSKFGDMIGTIGKASVAIGAAGLAAVAAFGFKAVSSASDFQKALNGLGATTGKSKDELGEYETIMKNIYNGNYGENFDDIGKSIGIVAQITGKSGAALEDMTTKALLLRDSFEFDVNESVNTANTLMQTFKITSDEAYTLIAQGAQNGANKNGDLIDTLNEYAPQFQALGFTAEQFTDTLIAGAKNGAFSIDKVGDAVKEFNIRAKDGSKTSADAFNSLGLDAGKLSAVFAKGGEKAASVFNDLVLTLANVKDPVEQNRIGVELFGTQFEDLGVKGVLALSNVKSVADSTGDTLKTLNDVKYDSFGEALTGIKRNLETSLILPLGEKLLPKLNEFSSWITAHMPEIKAAIADAGDKAVSVFNKFGDAVKWVKDNSEWLIPILGGVTAAITAQLIIGTVNKLMTAWKAITATQTIAQWALNVALNANPLGLVALAIGALIAVGILLYKNWDTISAFLDKTWKMIKSTAVNVFNSIIDFFKEWGPLILAALTGPIGLAIYAIIKNWDEIKAKTTEVWNNIKAFFVDIGSSIAGTFTGLAKDALEWGKNIIMGIVNGVGNMKKIVVDKAREVAKSIGDGIKNFFGIRSPSTLMAEYGGNVVAGLAKGISDKAKVATEAAKKMAQEVRDATVSELNKLGDAIITALKKRYAESEKLEIKNNENSLDREQKASDKRIDIYTNERDSQLKLLQDIHDPAAAEIQNQIDAINNKTDEEEAALLEQEYLHRKTEYEKKIATAENAEDAAAIQIDLDELVAKHERDALLESRRLKTESLKKDLETLNDNYAAAQEAANLDFEEKKKLEENAFGLTTTRLANEKTAIADHYAALTSEEAIQNEARILTVTKNNGEIVKLLNTYTPGWQNAGQSFGEALLDGLNSKKESIKTAVSDILALVTKGTAASVTIPIPASSSSSSSNSGSSSKPSSNSSSGSTSTSNSPANKPVIPMTDDVKDRIAAEKIAAQLASTAAAADALYLANKTAANQKAAEEAFIKAAQARDAAAKIPGLVGGGEVVESGRVLVGEVAPEILDLPRGARVTPLSKSSGSPIEINIHNPKFFNKQDLRQFGEGLVSLLRDLGVNPS